MSLAARAMKGVDLIVGIVVIVSVGFLIWRTPAQDSPDLISSGLLADAAFLLIGVLCLALLWPRGRAARPLARAAVWLAALILAGMAFTRLSLWRYERSVQHRSLAGGATGGTLRPVDAAEWALRVALHAASGNTAASLTIPEAWPLPPNTELALRELPGQREIWARVAPITCHASVAVVDPASKGTELNPVCDTVSALPPGVALGAPQRSPATAVSPQLRAGEPWLQHRGSSRRDASIAASDSVVTGWRAATHTQVRASASVVADLVLVGGHGSGLLVALDRATGAERWSARTPNWIHQDPVSDGRIVVVGFGDNDRSFVGRAPSGVAAFDLSTGQRLWTEFETRSVMTSPTIHDSVVSYASSDGILRNRLLTTGALLGSTQLPGGVIMGPPVRSGDTLVATLDGSRTCAVELAALRSLWCSSQPTWRMMGHSSASIDGGIVVASGVATAVTPGVKGFLSLPVKLQLQLLRTLLFPQYLDYHVATFAGQRFSGLDLRTGEVRWTSPFFPRLRRVDGHTAGTAAMQNGLGVIVLPLADTVVAFDTRDGAIRWMSGANEARGAPLLLGQQVVVAGRNGVIELRQLQDGALACTLRRKVGYDRAGPVVSGGLVIFANLDGEVEAIPVRELLDCTATGAVRPGIAQ